MGERLEAATERDDSAVAFLVAFGLYVVAAALVVSAVAELAGGPWARVAAGVALLVAAGWFVRESILKAKA